MNKLIVGLIAAAFSFGAFAQGTAPATTAEKPVASTSAPATKKVAKAKTHKKAHAAKKAASAA